MLNNIARTLPRYEDDPSYVDSKNTWLYGNQFTEIGKTTRRDVAICENGYNTIN